MTWIETRGEALYDAKTQDELPPPPKFVFRDNRAEVTGVRVLFVRDFLLTLAPPEGPERARCHLP